jgi:hypothetical protein
MVVRGEFLLFSALPTSFETEVALDWSSGESICHQSMMLSIWLTTSLYRVSLKDLKKKEM